LTLGPASDGSAASEASDGPNWTGDSEAAEQLGSEHRRASDVAASKQQMALRIRHTIAPCASGIEPFDEIDDPLGCEAGYYFQNANLDYFFAGG